MFVHLFVFPLITKESIAKGCRKLSAFSGQALCLGSQAGYKAAPGHRRVWHRLRRCYNSRLAARQAVAQLVDVSRQQDDMIHIAIICQIVLLVYHQLTTHFDFFPFNGARQYSAKEKLAEGGSNLILMILAPIGFGFHIRGLMIYGVIYYFFLLAAELIIWWIPYFTIPSGSWRGIYNFLLSCVTSNFERGDTLTHWCGIHKRLHSGTITFLPLRDGRPVPNLEHTILHAGTFITAIITTIAWCTA